MIRFKPNVKGGSQFCKCGNLRRPGQRTCRKCHALDEWARRRRVKTSVSSQ